MKKSKAAVKTWTKKHDEYITYGLTVYGSQIIHFWEETPRDTFETKTTVKEFLSGELNPKVVQYLGKEILGDILIFLRRKFEKE